MRCLVAGGLALAFFPFVASCDSVPERDYGKLSCFDAWPDAPPAAAPKASLTATPAVAWRTTLPAATLDRYRGVALAGDRVVTSVAGTVVTLDRLTGAQLSAVALSSSQQQFVLGQPAVDDAGDVFVQTPEAGVVELAPDGTKTTLGGPLGQQGYAGEGAGVAGWGEPLSLLGGFGVLAFSPTTQVAIDAKGAQIWSSGFSALLSMGHVGFGFDGFASYVVDLRTGLPAGRLRAKNGHDVWDITPLGGRGVVAIDEDSTGVRVVSLDTCGKEAWSTSVRTGCARAWGGVVGPGEIIYFSTQSCDVPSDITLVGVGPDGAVVSGPVATDVGPWAVGADGTLYAASQSSATRKSRLVAFSPALTELWHLDLDGLLVDSNLALADDGLLYARLQTGSGDETVVAIQTTSPGLAASSWPTFEHDNRATNWGGGPF
jgi:hypothetical protein